LNVAIIPARGGSKRIPRKNLKKFLGKPIIYWAIEKALKSQLFDRVIVSTEDDEIAKVAISFGAEIPFMRPKELSDDYTTTKDVMAFMADWLVKSDSSIKSICCIYPTAPFVFTDDLIRGHQLLQPFDVNFVIPVAEYNNSIFRSLSINKENYLEMLIPENFSTRTQDLPNAYFDVGQFYWGKPQAWIKIKNLYGMKSKAIIIPNWRVHDIDTLDDWRRAEIIAKVIMKNQNHDH
jgi:pseudaminic acid cytidylyltransferase